MNSHERVQMALNFEEPDRTPIFASFVPEIEEKLRDKFSIAELDAGAYLGNDMIKSCVGLELSFYGGEKPEYTCPWGIRWRWAENESGSYTEIKDPPLAGDKSKLETFQIPDPTEESQYDSFRELKRIYGDHQWMIGSSQISIFEAAWYLRGMEDLMMDMLLDPCYVETLMDKVMQFPLEASKKYAQLGADMVWFGDDIASYIGLSRSVLQRRFRKILNKTVLEEITDARIHKAIDLLRCTNLSIEEIAYKCGFSYPQNMGRVFQKHLERSPKHFRKK